MNVVCLGTGYDVIVLMWQYGSTSAGPNDGRLPVQSNPRDSFPTHHPFSFCVCWFGLFVLKLGYGAQVHTGGVGWLGG